MASTTTRKPRLSGEERKAAIVREAVRLFAEKGFSGTTTRELASAVGVSEPVLYQHFATKRDLYNAIIEEICQDVDPHCDTDLFAARDAEDDRAFFTRLSELLLDWYTKTPQIIRLLLFSAMEGHDLADLFFERQIIVYYEMLTDYIRRRIEKGAFRRIDPYLAARAFTGMVSHQGLAASVFGLKDLEDNRTLMIEAIVDIFLHGMTSTRLNHA